MSSKVEAVLGSYRSIVLKTGGLVAYWTFNDAGLGNIAVDATGHGHTGTYASGVSIGGITPDIIAGSLDAYSARFSSDGRVITVPHDAAFNAVNAVSVEILCALASGGTSVGLFVKDQNWYLYYASNTIWFYGRRASDNGWQPLAGPAPWPSGWNHLVATYDAVTGGRIYINGALVPGSEIAGQGTLVTNAQAVSIDLPTSSGVSEAAMYNTVLTPAQVLQHYRATVWNDITEDVQIGSIEFKRGIDGDSPTDCVAATGELKFSMKNDTTNSGHTLGYYSPASGQKRPGWDFGIAVRVSFTTSTLTNKVVFYGKIRVIAPTSGIYGERKVDVVAYDIIRDLAETDARQVTVQQSKTEVELLNALLAVLPLESLPRTTNFDAGVDSYPIAFDDLEGSAKALTVMSNIVTSSIGMLVCTGDGTLRYRSRQSLATGTSILTIDNQMVAISVPSSLDKIYNHVRVTTHPKTVSPVANEVLYSLPASASNAISMAPSTTIEPWTNYSDPNDRQSPVGGVNIVPPVRGTHYIANAAADGSGANLSALLSATMFGFGTTAKWTITNTSTSQPLFVTGLQVVGKAVRDPGPQTFESFSSSSLASSSTDRPINLDLPYQNDPYVGQSLADYTIILYSRLPVQIESVEFWGSVSPAYLNAALTIEPGDRVIVSETVTGVSAVACIVHNIEVSLLENDQIRCKLGLKPASTIGVWTLGVVGASELGDTTILGI
jgi:hypothetical protein